MNSAAKALAWELWRKNQWGFVVVIVLLAVCGLLSWHVKRLQVEVADLVRRDPNRALLASNEVLAPAGGERAGQKIQVTQGGTVLFERVLNPGQGLRFEAKFANAPELQIDLISRNGSADVVYAGPVRSRSPLQWSAANGRGGEISVAFDGGYTGEVQLAAAAAERWREAALAWSVGLLGFGVLVLLAIFGGAEPHSVYGFTGIPPRRFTLPVSTVLLVACPIVLGQVAVILVYLGWSWLVSPGLLPASLALPDVYYVTLFAAGLAWFQALVWTLPSFPKLRATLLTGLVLGILLLSTMPFLARNGPDDSAWLRLEPPLLAGLGLAWTSGMVMGWLGVRWERSGAWKDRAISSSALDGVASLRPRAQQFRSARTAQFWMEWRRNGRLALAVWIPLMVLSAAGQLFSNFQWSAWTDIASGVVVVGVFAATIWMAVAGLNLARDGNSKRLALSSFTAVRPLTTGQMIQAKLQVAAIIWVGGALVALMTWLLVTSASGWGGAMRLRDAVGIPVALVLLSLHLLIGILPLCLTGRMPGLPWSLLPLLLLYGLAINGMSWIERHGYIEWLPVICILLLGIKVSVAFWGFRRALLLKLTAGRWVAGYAAAWAFGGLLLVYWGLGQYERAGNDILLFLPGFVLLLPLARVALSPLALDINRHR